MKNKKHEWKLSDESTLLIIGNGFDLNLGLKTSYQDFLKSEKFQDLISKIDENYFAHYLQGKNKLQGWVNVESEISKYAIIPGDNHIKIDPSISSILSPSKAKFKDEYCEVKNALKEYLKTQKVNNDISNADAYILLSKMGSIDNLYILDFNYTLTAEILISKIYGGNRIEYDNVIHVHGSLRENDDIVFGVQDELNENDRLPQEYERMYKSSSPYLNTYGINDLFKKCKHIIFFGYSLGKTDSSYFKDFFHELSEKGKMSRKEIDIFYNTDDDLDKINNQIRNLADGHILDIRRNHDISLIPVNELDEIYTNNIVTPPITDLGLY